MQSGVQTWGYWINLRNKFMNQGSISKRGNNKLTINHHGTS